MTVNELINELHARVRQEDRDRVRVIMDCGSREVELDYVTVNRADGQVRLA